MKFAGKWKELENIILSKVTQTQKDKHGENLSQSQEPGGRVDASLPWKRQHVIEQEQMVLLKSVWYVNNALLLTIFACIDSDHSVVSFNSCQNLDRIF
ncbi:hypothetical protein STEG23_012705 [Scotinomys teguina]